MHESSVGQIIYEKKIQNVTSGTRFTRLFGPKILYMC